MCKVSDKSEMVGEIIGWFDMELPIIDYKSLQRIVVSIVDSSSNISWYRGCVGKVGIPVASYKDWLDLF